jgi:hypothetical protein
MKKIHKENFTFTKKEFSETISVKRLDDMRTELKIISPLLVKIDVQGFEVEVINGGRNTIREADMIIIETSFFQLYENSPLFHEIYTMLMADGFIYAGSFEQLRSPLNGIILQQDALFLKQEVLDKISVTSNE